MNAQLRPRRIEIRPDDRRAYIGSSDARDLVYGRWLQPWLEKTGRADPPDLSANFKVQLGAHTEPFHLDWKLDELARTGEIAGFKESRAFFMLDGCGIPIGGEPDAVLLDANGEIIPVEVKHSGREFEDLIDYYMPQNQHHMLVTGARRLIFSAIIGNEAPRHVWVGRSDEWMAALIDAYTGFWHHIAHDTQPPRERPDELAPVPEAEKVPINEMVVRDATKDNAFVANAHDYIATIDLAKAHEAAKKALKDSVKANEREVYCDALRIKRDARGALRFTVTA